MLQIISNFIWIKNNWFPKKMIFPFSYMCTVHSLFHGKSKRIMVLVVSTYFFYIMGESIAHPMCIKNHIPTNICYILLVYMFYITTKPNGKKRDDPKKRETESGIFLLWAFKCFLENWEIGIKHLGLPYLTDDSFIVFSLKCILF